MFFLKNKNAREKYNLDKKSRDSRLTCKTTKNDCKKNKKFLKKLALFKMSLMLYIISYIHLKNSDF